eukprot:scaffold85110_cov17-Tisochrysis_lutea.AAC.1
MKAVLIELEQHELSSYLFLLFPSHTRFPFRRRLPDVCRLSFTLKHTHTLKANFLSHPQSADDHRAKEALAKQQGYEPPQENLIPKEAHPPDKSPFQIFDMDESKPE